MAWMHTCKFWGQDYPKKISLAAQFWDETPTRKVVKLCTLSSVGFARVGYQLDMLNTINSLIHSFGLLFLLSVLSSATESPSRIF